MKYCVLAEKPNQAEDYAQALGQPKKEGMTWCVFSKILSAEVVVVAAAGHLVELVNPYQNYENWKMENLPVFPEKFEYKVTKGNSQRMAAIKAAIKEADVIIIGTDPDREGEAIAYRILNQIPGALKKVKYRLWCNSLTPNGIQQAFSNLRDATETCSYAEEAEARAISDWLVGFNMSPWVTLKMREEGVLEAKDVVTVGRVQTPVVRIVVENDETIENFTPEPYWTLQLIDEAGTVFKNDTKFNDYEKAQEALRELKSKSLVKTLTVENKCKNSPKLFNLTQLQSFMSQKYKIEASETLDLLQGLYQKKITSYPRSDSNLITENEFEYLKANVEAYASLIDLPLEIKHPEARKRYVDGSKVKEHYAIIPTEKLPNLTQLTQEEQWVYQEVVTRTLMMFASDYEYQSTQVELENNELTFKTSGNVTQKLGWREYADNDSKDKILPGYQEGQSLSVSPGIKADKTKPLTRLTEATLLENVLPKYDLGTSATRAGILENIQQRQYIKLTKKSGQLNPQERGRLLVYWLAERGIMYIDPELTSKWEEFLRQIGQGQRSKESFIDQTKRAILAQMQKGL